LDAVSRWRVLLSYAGKKEARVGLPEEESAVPLRKILPNFDECGIFLMMIP